ncbi:hypothetical protein R1T43_00780 [Alteromonas sp. CI.11.F.A3]|uniref:hypothetical protein n=1 Tax=Alteromonas sp. CI.11.F.A3 TaxID=3079555 RepID=UPI0029423528|nr:hypothetical protein [Alteromonas sp. CI.11.F.A3]WOI37601.1 hypothetical protein R1T43_00780 [Alteromonas sp. CI.11.F.A3]
MKLLIKWSFIVLLSAIAGIIGALLDGDITSELIIGMLLGIATFVLIYYRIDIFLMKRQLEAQRKSLMLAVKIKMALQLVPAIDAMAGAASLNIVGLFVKKSDNSLLFTYLCTLTTGLALSFVVGMIFFIIKRNLQNFSPAVAAG